MTYKQYIDLLWRFRGRRYNFKYEYKDGARLCYTPRAPGMNYKKTGRPRIYKGHYNVFKHIYTYNH